MLKTAEQWRTDVDYNHLPVRLVGRLSGLAMGYFGTSHYAVEDIAIARTMNNTTVLSPGDPASTVSLMRSTAHLDGPVYIRIAEGVGKVYDQAPEYARGQWPRLRSGGDITLIGHGMGLGLVAAAAEQLFEHDSIEADVFDAAYLRPYDEEALLESARKTGRVLTVEEHTVVGGLGSLCAEAIARAGLSVRMGQVALPDQDLEVGVPAELYEYYGLTVSNVAHHARKLARA
jgi:transketolase